MCELMSVFFFGVFWCFLCVLLFWCVCGGGGEYMLTMQYPNVHFHESLHYYLWVLVWFCCCFDLILFFDFLIFFLWGG